MSDRSEIAGEIGRIIQALDVLLTACEPHRATRQAAGGRASPVRIIAEMAKLSPVEGLLDDPIGRSLRLRNRRLGERLHQLGGFDLMQQIAERVADMCPASAGRRLSIVDH